MTVDAPVGTVAETLYLYAPNRDSGRLPHHVGVVRIPFNLHADGPAADGSIQVRAEALTPDVQLRGDAHPDCPETETVDIQADSEGRKITLGTIGCCANCWPRHTGPEPHDKTWLNDESYRWPVFAGTPTDGPRFGSVVAPINTPFQQVGIVVDQTDPNGSWAFRVSPAERDWAEIQADIPELDHEGCPESELVDLYAHVGGRRLVIGALACCPECRPC